MEATRIKNLSLTYINSFALKCAVDLDIAGHIRAYGEAMPLSKFARSIPILPEKQWMLGRLMALLVHQEIFGQSEAGYLLTPVSELLLTNESNMGAYVRASTVPELFKGWSHMSELFKDRYDTCNVIQKAFDGKKFWEVLEEPKHGALFNEAMASQSKPLVRGLIAAYPHIFDGLNSLVDVGGGTGTTARIIAEAFPGLRCTVFDLPHVIEKALKNDSFDVVGGDMFEKIPTADAIFLKNILHDWSDEDCVRILKRCKEAIESSKNSGQKVIVVDAIVGLKSDDTKTVETGFLFDIAMMCFFGSKERNKQEWHDIILAAGYSSYKIGSTPLGVDSVIELYP